MIEYVNDLLDVLMFAELGAAREGGGYAPEGRHHRRAGAAARNVWKRRCSTVAKNEQSREANQPIWFDGKSINEALFCDDFLGRHKIIYTNGAFFTPDGRVTDELPLRGRNF